MTDTGTATPRERYRAQIRAEIKEHAWQQIATTGASALSLNAIAKQMGMSGPALYRYYANRDELITELIRDAYRSLADTLRSAAEKATENAAGDAARGDDRDDGRDDDRGSDRGGGLAVLAHAVRDWALHDPQRYLLIYGTPVPGYHAPDDITAISSQIMTLLLDAASPAPPRRPETPLDHHLAAHRDWAGDHPAPPAVLHQALSFWTRIHGVLSLELAGHFAGMGFDPALLFAAELDDLLAR
ncbi:TetR/AcrR family transcriptional regulator [Nonomuraea sp. NPDC049684]|uniref:TetR/AcrR family transcriptional regulator n=1 Tax=unclassified Nonomuraea TaxID=2593643 RepID=UPI0037B338AF